MSFWGFLTGNSKSVEKVVDAGISGIDKIVFTEEEKAEYYAKLQNLHLQFVKIAATESTAQSISRRLICIPVVYIWILLLLTNVAFEIFLGAPLNSISEATTKMEWPALAAIGFYVGRHLARDWNKKK